VPTLEIPPFDETAPAAVREAIAAGFDVHSDEALSLAQEAAAFDERTAYRENGRSIAGRVGGGERCGEVLTLMIAAGFPHPGVLLPHVRWPDAARVILATSPPQAELDAGLLAQCDVYSFDPNTAVVELLLAAKPSQSALDVGLLRATQGAAKYRGTTTQFEFFDIFDAFLAAGARADHAAPNTVTALHVLTTFAPPGTHGARNSEKTTRRAFATFERALANTTDVNLPDEHGMTPLHVACHHGAIDRISALLARGADPQRRTTEGKLPSEYAHGNAAVYAVLGVSPPPPAPRRVMPRPRMRAEPPPPDPMRVSIRVQHAKFGFGEVTAVSGEGEKRKLTIRFDDGETRILGASFVTPL